MAEELLTLIIERLLRKEGVSGAFVQRLEELNTICGTHKIIVGGHMEINLGENRDDIADAIVAAASSSNGHSGATNSHGVATNSWLRAFLDNRKNFMELRRTQLATQILGVANDEGDDEGDNEEDPSFEPENRTKRSKTKQSKGREAPPQKKSGRKRNRPDSTTPQSNEDLSVGDATVATKPGVVAAVDTNSSVVAAVAAYSNVLAELDTNSKAVGESTVATSYPDVVAELDMNSVAVGESTVATYQVDVVADDMDEDVDDCYGVPVDISLLTETFVKNDDYTTKKADGTDVFPVGLPTTVWDPKVIYRVKLQDKWCLAMFVGHRQRAKKNKPEQCYVVVNGIHTRGSYESVAKFNIITCYGACPVSTRDRGGWVRSVVDFRECCETCGGARTIDDRNFIAPMLMAYYLIYCEGVVWPNNFIAPNSYAVVGLCNHHHFKCEPHDVARLYAYIATQIEHKDECMYLRSAHLGLFQFAHTVCCSDEMAAYRITAKGAQVVDFLVQCMNTRLYDANIQLPASKPESATRLEVMMKTKLHERLPDMSFYMRGFESLHQKSNNQSRQMLRLTNTVTLPLAAAPVPIIASRGTLQERGARMRLLIDRMDYGLGVAKKDDDAMDAKLLKKMPEYFPRLNGLAVVAPQQRRTDADCDTVYVEVLKGDVRKMTPNEALRCITSIRSCVGMDDPILLKSTHRTREGPTYVPVYPVFTEDTNFMMSRYHDSTYYAKHPYQAWPNLHPPCSFEQSVMEDAMHNDDVYARCSAEVCFCTESVAANLNVDEWRIRFGTVFYCNGAYAATHLSSIHSDNAPGPFFENAQRKILAQILKDPAAEKLTKEDIMFYPIDLKNGNAMDDSTFYAMAIRLDAEAFEAFTSANVFAEKYIYPLYRDTSKQTALATEWYFPTVIRVICKEDKGDHNRNFTIMYRGRRYETTVDCENVLHSQGIDACANHKVYVFDDLRNGYVQSGEKHTDSYKYFTRHVEEKVEPKDEAAKWRRFSELGKPLQKTLSNNQSVRMRFGCARRNDESRPHVWFHQFCQAARGNISHQTMNSSKTHTLNGVLPSQSCVCCGHEMSVCFLNATAADKGKVMEVHDTFDEDDCDESGGASASRVAAATRKKLAKPVIGKYMFNNRKIMLGEPHLIASNDDVFNYIVRVCRPATLDGKLVTNGYPANFDYKNAKTYELTPKTK